MSKLFGDAELEEARSSGIADKKHHELQFIDRSISGSRNT
jgi:hypothetical protein